MELSKKTLSEMTEEEFIDELDNLSEILNYNSGKFVKKCKQTLKDCEYVSELKDFMTPQEISLFITSM